MTCENQHIWEQMKTFVSTNQTAAASCPTSVPSLLSPPRRSHLILRHQSQPRRRALYLLRRCSPPGPPLAVALTHPHRCRHCRWAQFHVLGEVASLVVSYVDLNDASARDPPPRRSSAPPRCGGGLLNRLRFFPRQRTGRLSGSPGSVTSAASQPE